MSDAELYSSQHVFLCSDSSQSTALFPVEEGIRKWGQFHCNDHLHLETTLLILGKRLRLYNVYSCKKVITCVMYTFSEASNDQYDLQIVR